MFTLRTARIAIVLAGCLGMAHLQLVTSPASIEYARSLGGGGLHIGILGALPSAMLFMQFLAGLAAGRLRHRRTLWFRVSLVQRLVVLPAALGPWCFPEVNPAVWLWLLIGVTAVNQGLLQFCTPLWLSWMGDYLPHEGLSRYWGVRQLWMQWTAAGALFATALTLLHTGLSISAAYAWIIGFGALAGVLDICIFLWVEEPPLVAAPPRIAWWEVLTAPFRDPEFRSFIRYSCFWHVAAMSGAPFISFFLLDYAGFDLHQVLMLWTASWVGGAVAARKLGELVERCGHRPMLVFCTLFKSVNMAALLLTPEGGGGMSWLAAAFMFDAALNAGIAIATNGFLIKHSPRASRTMYIAAGTALAGLLGGLTSVAAGGALHLIGDWETTFAGRRVVPIHLLFAASLTFRLAAVRLALAVREPTAQSAYVVLSELTSWLPWRALLPRIVAARGDAATLSLAISDEEDPLSESEPDSVAESAAGERRAAA